ncbi:MAG TPA: GNAT family N-acetyltransferase [Anaerolineales bacterium]|nr:GNAT family N-acetyltransferase [Anaerolineales bacterium]
MQPVAPSNVRLVDRSTPRPFDVDIRGFVGPADYPAMVGIYSACALVDGLDEVQTIDDLATFMENPVGFDPKRDLFLAEVHGHAVGYAWVSHRVEAAGTETHTLRGYVHPSFRRRGIGSAFLEGMQARSLAWEDRPDGTRPAVLQAFAADSELGGLGFLPACGFAPIRYAYKMERDLTSTPIPSLPLPSGLEVRPADESQDRAIWEAEREAFQDHWGYTPWPEENFQRFISFPHYDRSLWRVAWDGDQVAGMVLNYINQEENAHFGRLRGYTEDIAVRRPWRRRGLARALIAQSLAALKDRGMTAAALGVDAENPTGALHLYESLGFRPVKQWTYFRRSLGPKQPDADPSNA